jgi:SAM-dependent methyltransferase
VSALTAEVSADHRSIMLKRLIDAVKPWPAHPVDRTYGIETSRRFARWRWRTGDRAADEANVGYVGSQPSVIRRGLLSLPPIAAGATFIDIGCGKGRGLAVATEYPFGEIYGVELLPKLVQVARTNLAKVSARHPGRTRAKVIHGDATQPPLPAQGDVVVYMYNPFSGPLVDRLLDSIEAHLMAAAEARIFVVYCNAVHGDRLDARSAFKRYFAEQVAFSAEEAASSPFGNTSDSLVIWQAGAPPLAPPHPGADREIVVKIPNLAAEVR